uniref:uncharacterized protein n=1 Tax=Pristiophorus japonicus TaxID=55135 RepID=UPI00398E59C5
MEKLLGPDVVMVTVGGGSAGAGPGAGAKRRKYYCTYNDNWCAQHPEYRPWLRKVDASTAQCLLCHQAFSIKYEGRRAVAGHADCSRHKEAVKNRGRPPPVPPAPAPRQGEAQEDQATAAELAEIYRGVSQHLSYSSLDCGGQPAARRGPELLPEPEAEEPSSCPPLPPRPASCGRTKAASLTENVLAPCARELLAAGLRRAGYFSLSADAANRGARNYFPLVVRYFDRERGLGHGLLDCYGGGKEEEEEDAERAGEALASRLADILRQNRLEPAGVSAYMTDVPAAQAAKHGAAGRRLGGPTLLQVSCRCRLLHDCLRLGLKELSVDVEWLVLKVCGELASSSSTGAERTQPALRGFCAFLALDYKELLRRAPVRWLSLLPALAQVAQNWEALRHHFRAAGEGACAGPVWRAFGGAEALPLCHAHFARHLMGAFQAALSRLEWPEATCAELERALGALLAKLQKRREDGFYGAAAQALLPGLPAAERHRFEEEAGAALDRCVGFLRQRYRFESSVFARMAALSLDRDVRWAEVEALARELGLGLDLDRLYDDYCALHRVRAEAAAQERRVDQRWVEVFKRLPEEESGQLFKLVAFVLSVPVSNGYCERVCSLMTRLWSKERNRLSEGLVKAELQVQLNFGMSCADFYQYVRNSPELLKAARSQLKYRFKKKGVAIKDSPQQQGAQS